MIPSSQVREVTLKDYLIIIQRRIWVITVIFFVISFVGTWQSFQKIPVYEAFAKVIIERTIPQISPIPEMYPTKTLDKEYIKTQIDVIKSKALIEKTVRYLISTGDEAFTNVADPVGAFLGGVVVVPIEGTQIIKIGYRGIEPLKVAKFANALAQNYIQQDIDRRISGIASAESWLATSLKEMHEKLVKSEENLINYIKENQILSIPDIERRSQTILENLKQEKIRIESEIAEASKRYKEKHPKMIALRSRLISINEGIEKETKNLVELNEKMVQYNNLKREVETNRTLYESLLKKTKETEVSKELLTTDLRILDLAEVPSSPVSPNHQRDITTSCLWGLFLGLGLAFFLEYLDATFKNADDIETYLRLPFLGYVASLRSERDEIKQLKNIDLISQKIPHSRIAESYRSIRTSVIFSSPEDRPLKTILLTSSLPREGKTFITINLGIVFAHTNEPMLILEADMRKPRIAKVFGLKNEVGLSSYLAGEASLEEIIRPTGIDNLFLISSGPTPPNPTELLISTKTNALLETLKQKFSRVIVDSPPLLYVTDTSILANLVDGVILVIYAGRTTINYILRSRQKLNEAKARIIGVILNSVDVKKEDSYYYYHYYYYSKDKTSSQK
ncbi:MAG: polysaccharide biosynthesis tyrosine autokinase [Candidatus Omnitrophica bacterium]|nr:polysaccharide biosynthesis tyrosine autokinase [Candidatus Omnitrophota bacterium]